MKHKPRKPRSLEGISIGNISTGEECIYFPERWFRSPSDVKKIQKWLTKGIAYLQRKK